MVRRTTYYKTWRIFNMTDEQQIELFEERAAIMEHDAGLQKHDAEVKAYWDVRKHIGTAKVPKRIQEVYLAAKRKQGENV